MRDGRLARKIEHGRAQEGTAEGKGARFQVDERRSAVGREIKEIDSARAAVDGAGEGRTLLEDVGVVARAAREEPQVAGVLQGVDPVGDGHGPAGAKGHGQVRGHAREIEGVGVGRAGVDDGVFAPAVGENIGVPGRGAGELVVFGVPAQGRSGHAADNGAHVADAGRARGRPGGEVHGHCGGPGRVVQGVGPAGAAVEGAGEGRAVGQEIGVVRNAADKGRDAPGLAEDVGQAAHGQGAVGVDVHGEGRGVRGKIEGARSGVDGAGEGRPVLEDEGVGARAADDALHARDMVEAARPAGRGDGAVGVDGHAQVRGQVREVEGVGAAGVRDAVDSPPVGEEIRVAGCGAGKALVLVRARELGHEGRIPACGQGLRLDGPGGTLQVPVSAQVRGAGGVVGGGHVGAGGRGEGFDEVESGVARGDVAAVEQDVALGGQGLAPLGELRGVAGDGPRVQNARSQPHLALGPVGQDVHGVHAASALKDAADLGEAVFTGRQKMDFVGGEALGRRAQAVQKGGVIANRGVDKDQFRGVGRAEPVGCGRVRGGGDGRVRGLDQGLLDGHRRGLLLRSEIVVFQADVRREQDAGLQGLELHLAPGFRTGSDFTPETGDLLAQQLQHIILSRCSRRGAAKR